MHHDQSVFRGAGRRRGYRLSASYDGRRRNATSGLSRGVGDDMYRRATDISASARAVTVLERCHYTRHVFRIGSSDVAGSRPVIYQGLAPVIGSPRRQSAGPIVSAVSRQIPRLIVKERAASDSRSPLPGETFRRIDGDPDVNYSTGARASAHMLCADIPSNSHRGKRRSNQAIFFFVAEKSRVLLLSHDRKIYIRSLSYKLVTRIILEDLFKNG